MNVCSACGAENEPGRKFCGECGSALSRACPSCGTPNPPTVKFCGECGAALGAGVAAPTSAAARNGGSMPASERRLVSVLFADLVGFTSLSESRDAEEVRELLSRYFDTCRTLIERYGGTVEKFIGDAVMALWGAPVATEHDAERAVRAALDLVSAVTAMGEEIGAPDLRLRAGVLTGEAAVNLGASSQGMVAGDMVNTASRIQSAAKPGTVLVGEATKRATEATIVFEEAGTFDLKGKTEAVPLWRARRVIAGALGSLKSAGLEPPFVGRDRELRTVKELLHASADERRAHLVSVTGIAGIGKSRLSWEFYKYFDGLEQLVLYHRGRCLSYGEGVAYWALVEMVKMRARIAEDEEPASAAAKLHAVMEEYLADVEEREWVEPRLMHLLGLEERTVADRDDLFAAWRLFFERMAEREPVVMIFEDLQWADAALLDFIEYLLEWSRNHAILVITLSRPELTEKRPTWGGASRRFTSLYLEPLPDEAMRELLDGLVPGLPEQVLAGILGRAEGVPLYAVETVRMLLDRGLLRLEGPVYVPTQPITDLEVPETLHALIAARLDALTPEERRIVQDGAVLGKTFFKEGLARLAGMEVDAVDAVLTSLVRKEILSMQADTRSPEFGQYGFLQDLLKTVAYETLSRHDRKAKHLEAATFVGEMVGTDEDELTEVLASHYLRAYEAVPDSEDAGAIRGQARAMVVRAGERAASLGANAEARTHFARAADLTDDPLAEAELWERAGRAATLANETDAAEDLLERAATLYDEQGEHRHAALARAFLAHTVWMAMGRTADAVARTKESFELLSEGEPDAELAEIASRLGQMSLFHGEVEQAARICELALEMGESLWLPGVLARSFNTKALLCLGRGRFEEAQALMAHALKLGLEGDIRDGTIGAYSNLAEIYNQRDRYVDAMALHQEALTFARRMGARFAEQGEMAEVAYGKMLTGAWDEAVAVAAELPTEDRVDIGAALSAGWFLPQIHIARGDVEAARAALTPFDVFAESDDEQERATYASVVAAVERAEGKLQDAIASARSALESSAVLGSATQAAKLALVEGAEAGLAAGDPETAESFLEVIEGMTPGERPPYLSAQGSRLRAKLHAARGEHDQVEQGFKTATGLFRELGVPFWMGVTLLEHGEWLASQGRSEQAGPLTNEAHGIFERLRATPWLERAERASTSVDA